MRGIVLHPPMDAGATGGGLVGGAVEGAVSAHGPKHSGETSSDRNRGDARAATLGDASSPQPQRVAGMIARSSQDGPCSLHEHGASVRVTLFGDRTQAPLGRTSSRGLRWDEPQIGTHGMSALETLWVIDDRQERRGNDEADAGGR